MENKDQEAIENVKDFLDQQDEPKELTERQKGLMALTRLRQPFPPEQISKLPKPTKAQTQCDVSQKERCKICGGFHHPKVVHLDYVGHAALTSRLLDVDPTWFWEPLASTDKGLPQFDETGGLWIKLTVCGMSRLGYGNAPMKEGPGDRIKEIIGDALRNAAMRFGAALDLWHKGELIQGDAQESETSGTKPTLPPYDFEKNKETLKDLVKQGRKIDSLINTIQTKATLTAEQLKEIKSWIQ